MTLIWQALVGGDDLFMHMALSETPRAPPHPKLLFSARTNGTNPQTQMSISGSWLERLCCFFSPLMSLFLILDQCPVVISHSVAFTSQLCRGYCRIKGAFIRLLGGACALPLAMEMNNSRDFYLHSNQGKKPLFSFQTCQ